MTEADELRAGIIRALESAIEDLVVGRDGDPHVGFLVLVYPEKEPMIIALTPAGAHSFDHVTSNPEEVAPKERQERFFSIEDLDDARFALDGASLALRCRIADVMGYVRANRERIRDSRAEAVLRQAAWDESHKARCAACGRRFTERGLPMHLARSPRCQARGATS